MKVIESPNGMVIVVSKIVAISSITEISSGFNFNVYTVNSEEPFIFRFRSKENATYLRVRSKENAINKRNEIIDILKEV
jgi:hypothetical protein